jgi:hypothetical protein
MRHGTDSRLPFEHHGSISRIISWWLEPLVLREFESFVQRTEQEIEEQRQRRERC